MSEKVVHAADMLRAPVHKLGVNLTDEQFGLIDLYLAQLSQYNEHTNLVSNADPRVVMTEHVLDALSLVPFIERFKHDEHRHEPIISLVDVGSGAGLPGAILAIALPYLDVTMLESVAKKVRFVETFITEAGLSNRARALAARAEELGHQGRYRECFHLATARAVGSYELSAELCMPLLDLGGQFLAQKSLAQMDEASRTAVRVLPRLGGTVLASATLDSAILEKERAVLIAAKVKHTGKQYPRRWAQIKSEPL
ncbi:MAG: 16S rRNA (guanine(527)-N(7))-methyltransferase RsmG [Terriglobales bacterium]